MHIELGPQRKKNAKPARMGVHAPLLPGYSFPLPDKRIYKCKFFYPKPPKVGVFNKEKGKKTCNILSNKHLHISSQRLRTDASDRGLIPTALVDCGKKSSAKLRLMIVTRY